MLRILFVIGRFLEIFLRLHGRLMEQGRRLFRLAEVARHDALPVQHFGVGGKRLIEGLINAIEIFRRFFLLPFVPSCHEFAQARFLSSVHSAGSLQPSFFHISSAFSYALAARSCLFMS